MIWEQLLNFFRNFVLKSINDLFCTLRGKISHQVRRIKGWLKQSDPAIARREGYQLRQSMVIVGSGGLKGSDAPEVTDLFLRRLPDDHTDFIFAVIGGQWGFRGCAGVLLIYVAIFVCGAEIAAVTTDPFARLLVVGVLAQPGGSRIYRRTWPWG